MRDSFSRLLMACMEGWRQGPVQLGVSSASWGSVGGTRRVPLATVTAMGKFWAV